MAIEGGRLLERGHRVQEYYLSRQSKRSTHHYWQRTSIRVRCQLRRDPTEKFSVW